MSGAMLRAFHGLSFNHELPSFTAEEMGQENSINDQSFSMSTGFTLNPSSVLGDPEPQCSSAVQWSDNNVHPAGW